MTAHALPPDQQAFLRGGLSIYVAGCHADGRPISARAVGVRLDPDGRRLNLMVRPSHGCELLDAVRANGRIAAVFCLPSTHKTLQYKGRDAVITLPLPADDALIEGHTRAFLSEVEIFDEPDAVVRAFHDGAPGDLVVVSFTPERVFSQTPGPQAGAELKPLSGAGT